MLRQLLIKDVDVVSHPEENRILVVGDPQSGLPELPGAQLEASTVADLFESRSGWDVVKQIHAESSAPVTASSVMQSLLTNDVRILHLAGHGVYDAENPLCSGMVIGGAGTEDSPFTLITPAEVRQMRLQPELVFINCCHLGRIEKTAPFHKLAANLAAQFIRSGVKAVVAAGWPVNDIAAATFCSAFYDEMLNGVDFGSAVKYARQETYKHESNTWGAYQCYGDPGFRLMMDTGVRARATGKDVEDDRFIDASELVIELGNLVSSARVDRSRKNVEDIKGKRDEFWTIANQKNWLPKTNVVASFARVAAELKDFRRAIELYEQASQLDGGGVTLADLEQLANFRTRYGAELGNRSLVRTAVRDLTSMIRQHGATAERLSLLGAANKRMIGMQKSRKDVRGSVRAMTEAYLQAADLQADDWYYPATNALLGVVLLGGPSDRTPRKGTVAEKDLKSVPWMSTGLFMEQLEQVATVLRNRDIRNFWDAVGRPDLDVLRAIADKQLDKRREKLVAGYAAVISLYGSAREIDSVIGQWSFASETARKLGNTELADTLDKLASRLREL